MPEKKTVFITGATGLLGSYLIRTLLGNNYRVYALARSKGNKTAKGRVEATLRFWDEPSLEKNRNNLMILEGDITQENLCLDTKTTDLLRNEIDEIFHCAALTQFNVPLDEIRKVNVEGVRNVLNLSIDLSAEGKLKKVNHISTAYVCGNHKGRFTEADLGIGQQFGTIYEQSKFEAEKLIQDYQKNNLWIDVFRPPLIIGESTTGKSFVFAMAFYQILHLWSLEILDTFPAKGLNLNVIPVDILSACIFLISSRANSINRTYHPFNNLTTSLEEILNIAAKVNGFKKPKPVYSIEFDRTQLTDAQKLLLQNNIFAFNPRVILDSTITMEILEDYGFRFPVLNEGMLSKLLKYPFTVKFKNEGLLR
jgi:thioester reductase-like protein